MNNQKIFLRICLLLLCSLLFSCKNSSSPDNSLVYFNSFESSSDLAGWDGIEPSNIVDDAPSIGGKSSIYISGGCGMPTSKYVISPNGEDNYIKVQCYGKNLFRGGVIVLCLGQDYGNEPSIIVKDTLWTSYQSENSFFWPADSSLTICLNSGGFVPAAMLIDELIIVKSD